MQRGKWILSWEQSQKGQVHLEVCQQGTDVEFEEQYAKSSARAKVLEDLEDGSVNPLISHNSKINIAYNPMNNGNLESGMMPIRKGIMPQKFETQRNVEACQAPVISLAMNVRT